MDPAVTAALVSSVIALFGVLLGILATVMIARRQMSLQSKELEIKSKELEAAAKQIESELETLRQTQFSEILRRRIEGYPALWSLLLKYNLNWKLAKKPMDAAWAKEHLSALNDVNAEIGIFFSQTVYEHFGAYRNALIKIESKLSAGIQVTSEELDALEAIVTGKVGNPGLASFLKNDLGSYRDIAIAIPQPRPRTMHLQTKSENRNEDVASRG